MRFMAVLSRFRTVLILLLLLTPAVRAGESISQLIRSNPAHYWRLMKNPEFRTPVAPFVRFSGIVTGDPHFGNFSVIPLIDRQGREQLAFADIDFDDAGTGSFVFDFARLVATSKAIEADLKKDEKFANVREMVMAYIEGLNGHETERPQLIQRELDKGIESYREELRDYVKKRIETKGHDRIKLVDGEIIELSRRLDNLKEGIPALFPDMEVLDVARVLKDRGGSAGSIRLWILLKDGHNERRIFELKQWQETGMTAYQAQKPLREWVRDLYPVFWPEMSDASYRLVNLGGMYFWLREKKKTLIDVPYEISSNSDLNYLQDLAPYMANHLGLIHGRQAGAAGLRNMLNEPQNQELLRTGVKEVYRRYLELAQRTLP